MVRKKRSSVIKIDSYKHNGKKRKNNPPVGLVSTATDKLNGRTKYKHDPHIDPQLSWAGKSEGTSFEVQNVSLHIHERIDPKRIIKSFLKKDAGEAQPSLFQLPDNELPLAKAIDFYRHEHDWTNRLIAGDSLLVMNSLLKKEGMAGKVQMIYIDPPYGIKYNSNFQPFVNKRDVKDGNDADIPAEPEMIQAFRDTWELGIHSYLTYLRDRLLLARELLHESGSVFVQISDENVHHVKELLDEIFGVSNFVALINFRRKLSVMNPKYLGTVNNYIVFFAKDINNLKFRKLFIKSTPDYGGTWSFVELPDGERRKMSPQEIEEPSILPIGSKIFASYKLAPAGFNASSVFDFEYNKKKYNPPLTGGQRSWKTNLQGMDNLAKGKRLLPSGDTLRFISYFEDFPYSELDHSWNKPFFSSNKRYVVETGEEIIQRCLLMTTDPGDLVFDPTCGSGTTAFVAEQWGRRWITCDTSRVAITLAKQRLMTAKYNYYELAHPKEGVRSGFRYKTVPHITLGSIANNEPAKEETLYDQPFVEKSKVRVTGPFTVEAVPCLRVKPFDGSENKIETTGNQLSRIGETGKQSEWRDRLKATGIRAVGGKIISFSRIEPMIGTRYLHAEGEILEKSGENKKAVISFGPDFGPLEQRQVENAVKEARELKAKPDFVIFAAFHFDPGAAKDIDEINWKGATILKAQMSVDMLTADLRKKEALGHSYWLIGQPDVEVIKLKDKKFKVKLNGFDYYDPISGEIISKVTKNISMWFLDTDYDERSLFPDQVFFPMGDGKNDWTRLAKALNGEVNEDLIVSFKGTESLPFAAGDNNKIAVKIIDNRGIESFVIKKLDRNE